LTKQTNESRILKAILNVKMYAADISADSGVPMGSTHTTLYRMLEKGLVLQKRPINRKRPLWTASAKGKRLVSPK